MNHQGVPETLLKMSLDKSHWNSVCDRNHMPTHYNQLTVGTVNQEEIFWKDMCMPIPQLDMKETFLLHGKIISDQKITK